MLRRKRILLVVVTACTVGGLTGCRSARRDPMKAGAQVEYPRRMKRWPAVIVCVGIGCGGGGGVGHLPDARLDDVIIFEDPPPPVTVYVTLAGAPVQGAAKDKYRPRIKAIRA